MALTTDRTERVEPGSELLGDAGTLVVEAARPHQDRWLVTFRGVATREDAEALRGQVLRAEPLSAEEGTLWVHELVGCHVVSSDGVDRGVVDAVQANPAADLLVLDTGHLVPVVFVTGPPDGGVVRVDVPDGLFDLAGGG